MPDAVEFNHTFHKCSAPRGPNLLSSCLCRLHSVLLVAPDSSPSCRGFSTRDSTHYAALHPGPQESYPKDGELVPMLSTLGCCPVNAGGVLGEERSFLCLALLSVALAKRVITKFRHHQPPTLPPFPSLPDSLTKRLLILQEPFQVPDSPGTLLFQLIPPTQVLHTPVPHSQAADQI